MQCKCTFRDPGVPNGTQLDLTFYQKRKFHPKGLFKGLRMEFLFFAIGVPQLLFNRKAEKRAYGWKMPSGTHSRRRFFSTGRPKNGLTDGKADHSSFFPPKSSLTLSMPWSTNAMPWDALPRYSAGPSARMPSKMILRSTRPAVKPPPFP